PALRIQRHDHEPAAPDPDEREQKNAVPRRLATLHQRSEPGCEQGRVASQEPDAERDGAEREDRQKGPSLCPTPAAGCKEEQRTHEAEPGARLHDEACRELHQPRTAYHRLRDTDSRAPDCRSIGGCDSVAPGEWPPNHTPTLEIP